MANGRALGLFAISAAATAGYAAVTFLMQRGKTRTEDVEARREVMAHATPRAQKVAEATGHIGKWYTHVPAAGLGAVALAVRGRLPASAAIAAASLGATGLSRLLDKVHDQPPPPPGKAEATGPDTPTYPSGHALETTAVAITSAWVAAREGLAPGVAMAPLAAVASIVSGLGRLLMDRHWASDAAAGYLAGIAVGTACAGGYELLRR